MTKRSVNPREFADKIVMPLTPGLFMTTKADEKVNTMVIGWGNIGRIWERDVFIAYVRECRYTGELLAKNPEFTINVPTEGFDKEAFRICGSLSGRDMDKIKEAKLTTVSPEVISVPGIKEFPLTLECRLLLEQKIEAKSLPAEIRAQFYEELPSEHHVYFGEILAAYIIED